MDIIQLYQDYSIPFVTEGHKHTREGWVNVECPYCEGNPGYHLGFHLEGGYYHCWRCGGHPVTKTLALLLHLPEREVYKLIKQYGGITPPLIPTVKPKQDFQFPTGVGPLQESHRRYLEKRGFDPDRLVKEWDLQATGPISRLDNINYGNRIIIPYLWDRRVVSFDSRSISLSASHDIRYIACPGDREIVPRKEILYGKQDSWTDIVICVEGPTDVWRFGGKAVAVSGIKYTPAQVRVLARFQQVIIVFDDDPAAKLSALTLSAELRFRGVKTDIRFVDGDPGGMAQDDADYFVKQLMK